MSDDIQHIDVDADEWQGTPRALREQVDKLQKALKTANQKITGFESERVETALSGVLTGYRNPGKVKADILRDKVDPLDDEAVAKWLKDNGDDYARDEQAPVDPSSAEEQPDPQADRAKLDAVAQIGQSGAANAEALVASVPKDLSPAETREWLIRNAGV